MTIETVDVTASARRPSSPRSPTTPGGEAGVQPLVVDDLRVDVGSPAGAASILRGVDVRVEPGQVVALAGESGSGKSTVLRAILRVLPPGGTMTGSITYGDLDVVTAAPDDVRRFRASRARMIFQDPWAALHPMRTIGWQLVESARAADPKLSKAAARERAGAALADVGVSDVAARMRSYAHEVSGGQAQRIMIAMALLAEPGLLLCDEPTTALDVTTQALILELLRRLADERGLSILIATHDLHVIRDLADRLVVMYAGKPLETGVPRSMMEAPNHPYTHALLSSAPQRRSGDRLTAIDGIAPSVYDRYDGCPFAPRCAARIAACTELPAELRRIAPDAATACTRHVDYSRGVVA